MEVVRNRTMFRASRRATGTVTRKAEVGTESADIYGCILVLHVGIPGI